MIRNITRFIAYGMAAVVAGISSFYLSCYLLGAVFGHTRGGIVARYPARLAASLTLKHRTYLPYGALPRCAIDGTVSVEDKRFFYEPGIDPLAIVRVAFASHRNDHQDHGGSTISQQLARMIIAEPRRHPSLLAQVSSELRVIAYALVVEHDFSKDKILELYLNSAYYGRGAHGFAQAAATYFHTDPAHLTRSQCYYLTGLPQAPSRFGRNRRAARERYLHVLATLRRNGYITSAQEAAFASSAPAA